MVHKQKLGRECTCGFKASGSHIKRVEGESLPNFIIRQVRAQQLELHEHIAAMTAAAKPKKRSKLQAKGPVIDPDGLFRDNLGESLDV